MRTTVTLDGDVERLLREAMHRNRRSFKQTLNAAIRAGLGKAVPTKAKAFSLKAKPMGLRAGIDPASLNKLVDEIEVDTFLEKTNRLSRS